MVEGETEDAVSGLSDSRQHGSVGRRTRMRLNVGVRGTEEALRALDRELLGNIHKFATAVVAAPRVAFGVLVGENRPLRLKNSARNEVLAGDHLESVALAFEFLTKNGSDLGIYL